MSEDVSVDRLKAHVSSLAYTRNPDSSPKALDRARDYIWGQMVGSGCYMLDVGWRSRKLTFHDVLGEKGAGFHLPPTVVVVAHYDTVDKSPGAGDNASGVAVMLEAARIIQAQNLPVRAFFAAVSMKEPWQGSSLTGSERLVAHLRARGIPVTAVICLDSVGMAGQTKQSSPDGLPAPLPPKGDFLAVVGCEASKALVDAFAAASGGAVSTLPLASVVLPGKGESTPDVLKSDQVTFWSAGYPALLLTDTGASRYTGYHATSDLPDRLNYSFMADVCRSLLAYAKGLAGSQAVKA